MRREKSLYHVIWYHHLLASITTIINTRIHTSLHTIWLFVLCMISTNIFQSLKNIVLGITNTKQYLQMELRLSWWQLKLQIEITRDKSSYGGHHCYNETLHVHMLTLSIGPRSKIIYHHQRQHTNHFKIALSEPLDKFSISWIILF